MLFSVEFLYRSGMTEERDKRVVKLFKNWEAPNKVEFKGFWEYADCTGGICIVEAESAELLLETTAPWAAFLEFRMHPLVPIEKSTPIMEKAQTWRDSID